MTERIAVIDEQGEIQYVNDRWSSYGHDNGSDIQHDWLGINYINECKNASVRGDLSSKNAINGISNVINKNMTTFHLEYPCHSPEKIQWFIMTVTPLEINETIYCVISHQDITERKLAEDTVKTLARIDWLTDIPNRRTFNTFIHEEWKRCARLNTPMSLAFIDIDHFKLLNDTYGHQYGDTCLTKVGELLKGFVKRPTDMCARYGGEEFVLVWGNTSLEQSTKLVEKVLQEITSLNMPNNKSPTSDFLTVSIGVAEMLPDRANSASELIVNADRKLYKSKISGRNRVEN